MLKELVGRMVNVDFVTFLRCDLQDVQDEKHALFLCSCPEICAVRAKYDHLFLGASSQTFVSLSANGFYISEICNYSFS